MTARRQVYKCEICGNIVEMLHPGQGELVCCGVPMILLDEKTADSTTEKHVPVLLEVEGGVLLKVGSVPHPMLDAHFIEWVEVHTPDRVYRAELAPGAAPEAFFPVALSDVTAAREYCNVHGLWRR